MTPTDRARMLHLDTPGDPEPTQGERHFADRARRKRGRKPTNADFANLIRGALGKRPLALQGGAAASPERSAGLAFAVNWRSRIGQVDGRGREVPDITAGLDRLQRWAVRQ